MPYIMLNRGLDYEQTRQGWQLRVHLAPDAIFKKNLTNSLEDIKDVLADVFVDVAVDIKLYEIVDQNELNEHYDGALSHSGKDRTQLGKEICIYLPDADVPQLSAAQYKERLLQLWKRLQENNIPLHYMNLPGDREVIVLDYFDSPFSYTSNNPDREEWHDKHGILFKEFKANGKHHPILDVFFKSDDLNDYGISRKSEELSPSVNFLSEHQSRAFQDISTQLTEIDQQQTSYSDFLFKKGTTETLLSEMIDNYSTGIKACKKMYERAEFQEAFASRIEKNMDYQFLINAHPKNPDSDFTQHPAIDEIRATIKQLTQERADKLINDLRTDFSKYVKQIEKDFLALPESLLIQFFPTAVNAASLDPTPVNREQLTRLISTNPSKMQTIFRQMAIIHQESLANGSANPAKKLLIDKLNIYKRNREKSPDSYLNIFGFLSRPFGAFSKKEKIEAVNNMIEVIQDRSKSLDPRHIGALRQGTLGDLLKCLHIPAFVRKQNRPAPHR